jgi:hypothetical protein
MKSTMLATAAAAFLFASASHHAASAAPQSLALIDSAGEVQFQCHDGACAVTLTAFCLQQERGMPATGHAYGFAPTDQVRLVGIRPDGSRVELDAGEELAIQSARRQLAVKLSLPASRMAELGLTSITIEVGRDVTLLPEAEANDPNPITGSEVAVVQSVLRRVGTRVVESDPVNLGAARWLQKIGNRLPAKRQLPVESRRQFLADARARVRKAGLSDSEQAAATDLLAVCEVRTDLGQFDRLRQCFEREHDTLLWRLNVDYWLAVDHGS